MITQQQLLVRIFTLMAHLGLQFALTFAQDVLRRYGEHAWIFSCGAEMRLHTQLPARAQSLQDKQ